MELTGDLAADWTHEEATWTFHLDDGFAFSDGEPVTAEDVVFTFDTLRDEGTAVDLSSVADVRASDDHTVIIELTEPDSLFGPLLTTVPILPEHAYHEDYSDNPVGSGPYRVVEHQHGEQLLMAANEHYPADLKYDELVFLLAEEPAALAAANAGDVDIVAVSANNADRRIDGMELTSLDSVETLGITLPTQPAGATSKTMGIEGPSGNDITADPAIRQALDAAVNREELTELVFSGHGQPAYSLADDLPWGPEKPETGDAAEASDLLAAAGWEDSNGDGTVDKNGHEAVVPLLYTASDPARADVAQTFAAQAQRIGIRFEPEGVNWDEIYARGKSGAVVWATGSLSPKDAWDTYSSAAREVGYNNMAGYGDEDVDKLLDAARTAGDLDSSLAEWRSAQTRASEDVPVVWLARRDHLYFTRTGVDIGEQPLHGHGHGLQIFQNVATWS